MAADSRGLLVYSAINPDSGLRADYARVPSASGEAIRWEMLSSRGTAQSFDGFPSTELMARFAADDRRLFSAGTVVLNHLHNRLVGASGGLWRNGAWQSGEVGWVALGPEPDLVAMTAAARTTRLAVGEQTGLTATGLFQPAEGEAVLDRNVTTHSEWIAEPDGVVHIDRNGGLTALRSGTVSLRAAYPPGCPYVYSEPLVVEVAAQ